MLVNRDIKELKRLRIKELEIIIKCLKSAYLEIKVYDEIAPLSSFSLTIPKESEEGRLIARLLINKYQQELEQLKKEIDQ